MPTEHVRARAPLTRHGVAERLRTRVFMPVVAASIAGTSAWLSGCPNPEVTSDFPDAFRMSRDIGPVDAFRPDVQYPDAPLPDMGPTPDAARDAPGTDVGRDAGSSTGIVIDGRLTERVWSEAVLYDTAETTFGPYAGTYISRFHYVRSETELVFAFEGSFPVETSVIALYLDLEYPEAGDGVVLQPTGLGDRSGEVDSVLSNGLTTVDATFRPEIGFGVADRPHTVSAGAPTIGWRRLSQSGAHTLLSAQRSACTAMACETMVSLEGLGVSPERAIGFVLRVGDSALIDTWIPLQTIPYDASPEFVSFVQTIPPVGS